MNWQEFKKSHDVEVKSMIDTYGVPQIHSSEYNNMNIAYNTMLTYTDKTIKVNTQKYGDKFGHNVFIVTLS